LATPRGDAFASAWRPDRSMTRDTAPSDPRPAAEHPKPDADARPAVAIIANSKTPYRIYMHTRIAREIPGIRLYSLFTHELSNAPWVMDAPPEIGPVSFGSGEKSDEARRPTRLAHEWVKGGRIIDWLREHNVAAVAISGYSEPALVRVIRWCRRNQIPSFLIADSNIRGDLARGAKALLKRVLVRRVVKSVTGCMPCGSLGRAYFAKYGADERRMFNFPQAPDSEAIERITPAQVESAIDRFKLDRARRRIIYSGRLAAVKRVDLLIDAFARIAPARPDWDLVIAGDGPLAAELKARVPAALAARVTWTGFIDDQSLLSALYRACDALVLPSDYEPWAVVMIEAAAAGLAIVSSDVVGASPEMVREGVNGRTFKAGSVDALEQALLDVTSPDCTDEMKQRSADVLKAWRETSDPVAGFRAALRFAGVLRT